jgi:hypothetical protein
MAGGARWRWGVALGCLLAVASLAGCGKKSEPGSAAPAAVASGPPPGATLAIAGQFFDGSDPAAIRAYLQSVREIKPKKFDVQWSPDTVAVGRDEAMRSLRAVSEDGSVYTLASSEPAVAKLKPGSILWIYDIAVRRVDHLVTDGDATLVYTKPIALTEAFTRADIEFDSPASLPDYYSNFRPHLPRAPKPAKTSRVPTSSPFRLVAFTPAAPGAEGGEQAPGPDAGSDANSGQDEEAENEDDYGEGMATSNGYTGSLAGFEYSLDYKARPDHLSFELEARKEEEGEAEAAHKESHEDQREEFHKYLEEEKEAKKEELEAGNERHKLEMQMQALDDEIAKPGMNPAQLKSLKAQREVDQEKLMEATKEYNEAVKKRHDAAEKKKKWAMAGGLAKKVFEIVSDNVDIRFRSKVELDQFSISGVLQLAQGQIQQAATQFKNLNGHLDAEFIGRLGEAGSGAVNVPVVHIPVVFNEPFPIYGLPFVIQFGGDFLVKVFLSGKHASIHWTGNYKFSGSGGFHADKSKTDSDSTLTATEPEFGEKEAMSPGTSGVVVAVQLPRLGFGFGAFGASSVAYIDWVNVLTTTNSAAVAVLGPQCKRMTLAQIAHVGIDTEVMPLPVPFIQSIASGALSPKKELYKKEKVWVDPDIKMCRIGGE